MTRTIQASCPPSDMEAEMPGTGVKTDADIHME